MESNIMNQREEIKLLLEKYFEGTASLNEEAALRDYFTSSEIAEEFLIYKPIFVFMAENQNRPIVKSDVEKPVVFVNRKRRRLIVRSLTAFAACGLIVAGVFLSRDQQELIIPDLGCTGTYILIEGECYSDPALVFSHAEQALSDLDRLFGTVSKEEKE